MTPSAKHVTIVDAAEGRRRRSRRDKTRNNKVPYTSMDGARVLLPGEDPWPLRAEVTDDSVFTRGGDITVVCTSTALKKCLDRWFRARAAWRGV